MDVEEGLVILNQETGSEITKIKPRQLEVLQKARYADCFASLKTGYGKTLIFQLLPYVMDSVVIVLCPLDVIIEQCIERFRGAICVDDDLLARIKDEVKLKDMENDGDYLLSAKNMVGLDAPCVRYFIGHPEKIIAQPFKELLHRISAKISHIVVDEAHTVATWGTECNGNPAFRAAFGEIRTLRSIVPHAKVLALTATATVFVRETISAALLMGVTFPLENIITSPDREGVILEVKSRPPSTGGHDILDSYLHVLDPLFAELEEHGIHFHKTILYLPLAWCGMAHKIALQRLSDEHHNRLAQYHSPQSKALKKIIPTQLAMDQVRLVFATEAFGMGADVKDIRRIIHITCPSSVETYMQEIGRAGRDGMGANAILYVNGTDLASKHVNSAMKEYCKITGCRREFLLQQFGEINDNSNVIVANQCCDNCTSLFFSEDVILNVGDIARHEESLNSAEFATAKHLLSVYFNQVNSYVTDCMFPEAVSGLSIQKIDAFLKYPVNDKLMALLRTDFANVQMEHLSTIAGIINYVKDNGSI